jgi:hypothetical protein
LAAIGKRRTRTHLKTTAQPNPSTAGFGKWVAVQMRTAALLLASVGLLATFLDGF